MASLMNTNNLSNYVALMLLFNIISFFMFPLIIHGQGNVNIYENGFSYDEYIYHELRGDDYINLNGRSTNSELGNIMGLNSNVTGFVSSTGQSNLVREDPNTGFVSGLMFGPLEWFLPIVDFIILIGNLVNFAVFTTWNIGMILVSQGGYVGLFGYFISGLMLFMASVIVLKVLFGGRIS